MKFVIFLPYGLSSGITCFLALTYLFLSPLSGYTEVQSDLKTNNSRRAITSEEFLVGGIQVNEPDHVNWANSLSSAGLNTVSVTVYAHQGDWNSENLWFDKESPAVISEIREAKNKGLRVVLILRLALDHSFKNNTFLWHGMIMPKTDSALDSWFLKYGEFVGIWSKIAEAEGVDVLGIASELNSMTSTVPVKSVPSLISFYLDSKQQNSRQRILLQESSRLGESALIARGKGNHQSLERYLSEEQTVQRNWAREILGTNQESDLSQLNTRKEKLNQHWRRLIADVKAVFRGKLTYAANFDQYQEVGFWADLDYLGINSYFPLRPPKISSELISEELKKGWKQILSDIDQYRKHHRLEDKPIIFTELGYTFRRNSTVAPWASDGFSIVGTEENQSLHIWKDEPIDYTERVLALRALRQNLELFPGMVQGLLYWKLSTLKSHIEIEPFVHVITNKDDQEFSKELSLFNQ